jgi:integrase
MSASTRAKHLRVLGACLQSAARHGYAARNPVRDLPRAERPRPEQKEAAYFENDELPRLFAEVPDGQLKTLLLLALKTGMRQGEILALRWGDIDLQNAVIRVRRSYTDGVISTPKNHERRDVDLTGDLVELLGSWWGECGRPTANEVIVFPGESASGHLSGSNLLRRCLYPAMTRAGIARLGPTGEPRVFALWRFMLQHRDDRHHYGHLARDSREPAASLLDAASHRALPRKQDYDLEPRSLPRVPVLRTGD